MPFPERLHTCGYCGQETGCTTYGTSWICGRASCWLAAMRAHIGI